MQTSRKASTTSSLFIFVAIVFYALFVSAALLFLPPLISVIFCVLPFGLLFFNQNWDFSPPFRLLHILFTSSIVLFILWPRYIAFNFGGPDITPSRIAYLLLLLVWIISLFSPSYRKNFIGQFKYVRAWLAIVGIYVILRILSCFFSLSPLTSFYLIAKELFTFILILPIVISIYQSRKRYNSLVLWIFLAGLFVAVLAILESTVRHNLFANISLPGMHIDPEFHQQAIMDKLRGGKYRAQSTFEHPLLLAEFMIFELPLAMFYMAHNKLIWRIIGSIAFVAFIYGAISSGSRSALVAIPIVILLAISVLSTRKKNTFEGGVLWILTLLSIGLGSIAGIILLATGVADLSIITGKGTEQAASSTIRVLMLERGLPIVANHFFVGQGPGLAGYILGFGKANGSVTIDNYYLSIALESGIPALMSFIVLTFGFAIKGYFYSFRCLSREGLLAGMLGISVAGMLIVKSILSIPHNGPLLYLAIALIAVIPLLPQKVE